VDEKWPSDFVAALQGDVLSMPTGKGIGAVVVSKLPSNAVNV